MNQRDMGVFYALALSAGVVLAICALTRDAEAKMVNPQLWNLLHCQNCGAIPREHGKPLEFCPCCYGNLFAPLPPNYSQWTKHDQKFLRMIEEGVNVARVRK